MDRKDEFSQSYSRRLSQRLAALAKMEKRPARWDVWIGGLLFLVGYAVLSARFGTRIVVNTGSVRAVGKKHKVYAVESFKEISPDLFSHAKRILSALRGPSIVAIQEVLDEVMEHAASVDDDFLSWVYQALKKDRSDAAFKRVMKGKGRKKLAHHALLVATQFFTDRYMVDFLVRESLARANIGSKSLDQLAIIDPACGAGNFLLSAFDFLWEEFTVKRGQPAKRVAQVLVQKVLVGYDLDPLLAALCRINMTLKAARFVGMVVSPEDNIFGGNHFRHGFLDLWDREGNSS